MNNTINNRVPGIPGTYQEVAKEVAKEANLALDWEMKELRSMINVVKVPSTYLGMEHQGMTTQSYARD